MKNIILVIAIFFMTHFAIAQNYSLDFDGIDDLVTSPVMNDTLNTIEFWVKNDVGINGVAQLSLPFNFSSAGEYISFNNCCSGVSGETVTIVNDLTTPSSTNQILSSGWHHIAFTSNGYYYNKIYIDGILANMISSSSPIIYTTKLDLGYRTIGSYGQFPYSGRFDEIRIWKVSRTQTEIQNNMNSELTGNEPNLLLYYKMDDINSPCDIPDCTPFGFNGIRTGANGTNNRPQFSTDVPLLTLVACGASNNCINVSIVSSNYSICNGQSVTLTASGGITYQWSGGSASTSSTIIVSPIVTTTYYLQATNGSVIVNDSLTIQVNPVPVASISGNQNICSGQSTILTANGASSYQWGGGSNAITNTISVTPSTPTNYIVTPSNGACQGDPISVLVNVNPSPTADAGIDQTISAGNTVVLNGNGGGGYLWSPSIGLDCSTCQNPMAHPLQTTIYSLTVTDTNGCSAVDWITVEINCGELFVPSAFSPNEDTENNFECVYGKCIQALSFVIFDRWGEKVFETDDQSICWDGTFKGKKMDTAVFVYFLKATLISGEEVFKKGNISLIK